tara:strand:+ start:283 stop:2775 length:2493 start_codon:yes stop_codon:yes gene_type:complete
MPRQSLQLNDFSGGLNTKSSPRDIAPNELSKADNVVISNPGLIESASDSSAKLGTANAPNTQTTAGYGAFMFNSQYNTDSSGTIGDSVQVFAYPEDNASTTTTKILTYARAFGNSGNFTLTEASGDAIVDMQVTGGVHPVYYYVDGSLYISDAKVVDGDNSTEPRKLQYVSSTRLGSSTTVVGWYDTTMKVEIPGTSNFESIDSTTDGNFSSNPDNVGGFDVILSTDPSTVSTNFSNKQQDSSNIITTTNPGETAPSPNEDINATDKTIYLKTEAGDDNMTGAFSDGDEFFINGEGFKVRGINVLSPNTVVQLVVDRDVYGTGALMHPASSNVTTQSSSTTSVTGGGWEAGTYEFTHTIIDLQDNETLPQAIQSNVFNITEGSYFTRVGLSVKFEDWSSRKNEKGVRIYTRKKGGNGRWILFLDVDWRRGVRSNLFEKYKDETNGFGSAVSTNFKQVKNLDIVNPSLDNYESINGYSQDEESIDFGTDGGYKAATVCARRAWVANVRKNDVVYDDRVYYTPVNRFGTFPDSYYLDIGISDGDAFTALHSLGNRLLAFKQKKLYVINVSSTSDAGWYLEAEYEGMGCINQSSVSKTPFGVAWVNSHGVYLFDGQSMPKELTLKLDDNLWNLGQEASNVLYNPSIGYDNKYKQLFVLQDSAITSNSNVDTEDRVFVFDFPTQSWTTRDSIGTADISNFVDSYDGIYFFKHSDDKIHKVNGDTGTKTIELITKDIDFGNPGLVKKVKKVYVTARDAAANSTLTLSYALDGSTSFTAASVPGSGQATINNAQYEVNAYTINQNCESVALKLVSSGKIDINDINIDFRLTNKRPS